jgi:tetratricopeptide (TPR) repeat protein
LAAKYYQKSVDGDGPTPAMFKNYGMVLATLGHFNEAMDQFRTAAKMDPASADPHALMGSLLLQIGRDAEAVPHLRQVIQLDPQDLQAVILMANLLAADEQSQARNGAEALKLAEQIVRQTGDHQPVALDALAMAKAEIGQFDDAIRIEQTAINLTGTNSAAVDLIVMQKRLAAYQKNQPWRESFQKSMPTPQKLLPK